jgi:hypothetical protein
MSHPLVTQTTLRVRYAETDAMGVVYHANYLIWFEAAAATFSVPWGRTIALGKMPATCCQSPKSTHAIMPQHTRRSGDREHLDPVAQESQHHPELHGYP